MESQVGAVPMQYDGEFGAYMHRVSGAYERAIGAKLDALILDGDEQAVVVGGNLPMHFTKSASTVEADIRQMFGYPLAIGNVRSRPRHRQQRRKPGRAARTKSPPQRRQVAHGKKARGNKKAAKTHPRRRSKDKKKAAKTVKSPPRRARGGDCPTDISEFIRGGGSDGGDGSSDGGGSDGGDGSSDGDGSDTTTTSDGSSDTTTSDSEDSGTYATSDDSGHDDYAVAVDIDAESGPSDDEEAPVADGDTIEPATARNDITDEFN